MPITTNGHRITRTDLEVAFSRTWGDGHEAATAAVPKAVVVAGALALAVVTLVFMAGKRRGRRRSPVVEIRRI
ncbi:MAG: hypothetical protein ACRDY3_11095 [Acidimicrobiales bacterium]